MVSRRTVCRPRRGELRVSVDTARLQWEDGAGGSRRSDPPRYRPARPARGRRRRRAPAPRRADVHARSACGCLQRVRRTGVRDVVIEHARPRARAGLPDSSVVQDAAFAQYARGAWITRPVAGPAGGLDSDCRASRRARQRAAARPSAARTGLDRPHTGPHARLPRGLRDRASRRAGPAAWWDADPSPDVAAGHASAGYRTVTVTTGSS